MKRGTCNTRYVYSAGAHDLAKENALDHFSRSPLALRTYSQALIVPTRKTNGCAQTKDIPGGGVYCDGRWISGTQMHRGFFPPGRLEVPDGWEEDDSDVVYLGMFYRCWGHCITDCIKHLWPFVTGEIRPYLESGAKLVYVTLWSEPNLPKNFVELLSLLGIDFASVKRITEPTRFRRVIVPDESFYYDVDLKTRFFTHEYRQTIDELVKRCGATALMPSRLVYLSRAKWLLRRNYGERDIEEAFGAAGYEVVYPEDLSFAEMVRLMRSCRKLATTEGSIAHNCLFMRDGTELVILRKSDYTNTYQSAVNDVQELNVTFIDANRSTMLALPTQPWSGPFFLYVSKELADYLGVRSVFPYCSYALYLLRGVVSVIRRQLCIRTRLHKLLCGWR